MGVVWTVLILFFLYSKCEPIIGFFKNFYKNKQK